MRRLVVILGTMVLPVAVGAVEPETWFLMRREGGCTPIPEAAARRAEFQGIDGPDAFIRKVLEDGGVPQVADHRPDGQMAVEVTVPSYGLAVVFVGPAYCEDR